MKTTQKGFTVVEALIVLLILVLAGGAGWFVYQKNHKESTASNTTDTTNTATNENTEQAAQADPYEGWITFKKDDFTALYPSNWVAVELDTSNSDPNIDIYHFGIEGQIDQAAVDGGAGKSRFTVSVYREGYYMGDVDGSRQLVDDSIDAATFARYMNGLIPEEYFSQVEKQTRTIDGKEAVKYVGGNYNTPWTVKSKGTIYAFKYYNLPDSDSIGQNDMFELFLKGIMLPQ